MNPYENCCASPTSAVDGYLGGIFRFQGFSLPYRMKLPSSSGASDLHPLLLIMHDSGCAGNDNHRQLYPASLFESAPAAAENSPIILIPQCPEHESWVDNSGDDGLNHRFTYTPTPAMAAVLKLLDQVLEEQQNVDFSRIYVVGAGTGGDAAWDLICRRPDRFAGGVIVGGNADYTVVGKMALMRVALFHGADDSRVPAAVSRRIFHALEPFRNVRYTEYPGVGNDAWISAYSDPATAQWLFDCKLNFFTSMVVGSGRSETLCAHGFRAAVLPDAGGNIVSLRHESSGQRLLREPKQPAEQYLAPERFGLPMLFPPNRIADGSFTFHNRKYALPVVERIHRNHLHGLVVNRPWKLIGKTAESLTLRYEFTARDERFAGFPHEFVIDREYSLSEKGLTDRVTVSNRSSEVMPLGLGFHSAFPAEDVLIRMGVGAYSLEVDARILPTGKHLPWGDFHPALPFVPTGRQIGFHAPMNPAFHEAELVYPAGTLRYVPDAKFKYWYTWNCGGANDFICLEPVSWISNAPNQPLPPEESGMLELEPGTSMSFVSSLIWEPARSSQMAAAANASTSSGCSEESC